MTCETTKEKYVYVLVDSDGSCGPLCEDKTSCEGTVTEFEYDKSTENPDYEGDVEVEFEVWCLPERLLEAKFRGKDAKSTDGENFAYILRDGARHELDDVADSHKFWYLFEAEPPKCENLDFCDWKVTKGPWPSGCGQTAYEETCQECGVRKIRDSGRINPENGDCYPSTHTTYLPPAEE